jgi:hypothetical protein
VSGHVTGVAGPAALHRDHGPAEPPRGGAEQVASRVAGVHAGPLTDELRFEARAAHLAGERLDHAREGVQTLRAQVAEEVAARGHDVERLARVHDRRDRAETIVSGRVVRGGDALRGRRQRQQGVAPLVGRGAGVRREPVRAHAQGAGRLALDDDALPRLVELAGLEAQHGVHVGEGLRVREPADAPLLIVDEQQGHLGVRLGPRGERAQDADRQDHAALHVDRSGADQAVTGALERAVRLVRDDRVEVAEQQELSLARPSQAQQKIGRVARGGAWDPLRLRLRGCKRGAQRDGLLGARDVAGRRGDRHECLELAFGVPGDLGRRGFHPGVHGGETI